MYMHATISYLSPDLHLALEFAETSLEEALALALLQQVHLLCQVLSLLSNQLLRETSFVLFQLTEALTAEMEEGGRRGGSNK